MVVMIATVAGACAEAEGAAEAAEARHRCQPPPLRCSRVQCLIQSAAGRPEVQSWLLCSAAQILPRM